MSDEITTKTRIAIPSEAPGGLDARRSGHFGRCECFTMVDVIDGRVGEVESSTTPPTPRAVAWRRHAACGSQR